MHTPSSEAPRRLSDLRRARPADSTLQNLLQVLNAKIELCGRLAVYEYEAGSEGHDGCAEAFRELAEVERSSFDSLLTCLPGLLAENGEPLRRSQAR